MPTSRLPWACSPQWPWLRSLAGECHHCRQVPVIFNKFPTATIHQSLWLWLCQVDSAGSCCRAYCLTLLFNIQGDPAAIFDTTNQTGGGYAAGQIIW